MTHGSLFSGIGGFDLAAEWMGWDNVFHVERDPFCRQVLAHHFPKSKPYEDIKTFDATAYAGRVDIISGGFPCQPFSAAGNRRGTSDDRYLWPEMFRVITEVRPKWVVAENVRGLLSWNEGLVLDTVCADLEGEGYEVAPVVLPAAGVNAPHRRDRIWIVARDGRCRYGLYTCQSVGLCDSCEEGDNYTAYAPYTSSLGRQRRRSQEAEGRQGERVGLQPDLKGQSSGWDASDAVSDQRPKGGRDTNRSKAAEGHAGLCDARPRTWENFPSVAPLCGGDDGLPTRLDGITFSKWRRESIKAYGNAIVPQVAYQIFKALQNERDVQGSLHL
jgi:DNA (cytosine-5)-methyltransferase 1